MDILQDLGLDNEWLANKNADSKITEKLEEAIDLDGKDIVRNVGVMELPSISTKKAESDEEGEALQYIEFVLLFNSTTLLQEFKVI